MIWLNYNIYAERALFNEMHFQRLRYRLAYFHGCDFLGENYDNMLQKKICDNLFNGTIR